METKAINPWTWQDRAGFSQGVEVRDSQRTLYCAGQTSVDAEGNLMYPGDIVRQAGQALDNLETVLRQAGFTLANVVRLNYYTTDMKAFYSAGPVLGERLGKAGCKPASTLLGVASLFHPDIMLEIEATAVG